VVDMGVSFFTDEFEEVSATDPEENSAGSFGSLF